MRISIRVDSAEAMAFVKNLEPNILAAVRIGLVDFMDIVRNRVVRKLSGEVLRVRTSRLRDSIHSTVQKMPWGFLGKVGTNVKYAAIHEYGGTIHHPGRAGGIKETFRQRKGVITGRKETFFKPIKPYTIKMQERSYLRSSLAELSPKAPEIILAHVERALKNA